VQEQQRAVKAAQQQAKVSQEKSTTMVSAVNLKEKQPRKDVGDDVRLHVCMLSLVCGTCFISEADPLKTQSILYVTVQFLRDIEYSPCPL